MSEEVINGVDVSKCKLYDYGICDSEMAEYLNCEQNPQCYFKQLKRLQKENKKLKESANEARIEYENLLINRNDFAERAEKYRQALEEIREIALKKEYLSLFECLDDVWDIANKALSEVLNDRD